MTAWTSSSGADAPAVTPTVPVSSSGSSSGPLTRNTWVAPASRASLSSARVFDELAEPITTMASQRSAMAPRADWRLVVAKHRSLRPGFHSSGKRSAVRSATAAQSRCEQRGLGEQGDRLREGGQGVDLVDRLDPVDGVGRDRHRADRLLVALVADVDDLVALAGPHLHLVVDLGDERAHRVDDVAAAGPGRGHDLGGRAVGGEHDRAARRHLGDVVDEDHAEVAEAVDDELVVDDLVVAVHRRLEGPHHPGQGLDGHLHAGAEAPGGGEQHLVDGHRAAG